MSDETFNWFEMKATAPKKGEIVIYDTIGKNFWDDSGMTAGKFLNSLRKLEAAGVEEADLLINSPGGNMMDGNTIYNLLKESKIKFTATVHGYAASAASLLLMAADKIRMPENAMLMIHNPSNYVGGDAAAMRKMADTLDLMKKGAVSAYAKRSGQSEDKVSKMMDETTWMTAAQAKANGFADEITDEVTVKNSFDWAAMKLPAPPDLSVSGTPGAQSPATQPVVPEPVMLNTMEVPSMAVQNPATPVGSPATVTMTQEQLDAMVNAAAQKAVAESTAPAMQALMEARLDGVRKDFAQMVSDGKLTPAQSKMFGALAETLMASDKTFTFSLKDDGSNEQTGSAIDLLKAAAGTMKAHGLLQEQVPTADAAGTSGTVTLGAQPAGTEAQLAAGFKASKSEVPDANRKTPDTWLMDKYIREVIMPANPNMSYTDAAMKTEKDEAFQKILADFQRS